MRDKLSYILSIFLMCTLVFISCERRSGRRDKVAQRTTNAPIQSNRQTGRQQPQITPSKPQVTSSKPQQALPLNQLYNKYKNSVFFIYTSDGKKNYFGTGFFISRDGLAISNYHVFEGKTIGSEVIQTIDEKQFRDIEILEQSKEYDYIIFRVNTADYQIKNPIPISSHAPQIGDDVFAIGNPEGLANTLSKGIISGYRDNNSRIQTTAEITHGSSGGPLMNMNGEVIGITTSGVGEANLNFAINIKILNLSRFK